MGRISLVRRLEEDTESACFCVRWGRWMGLKPAAFIALPNTAICSADTLATSAHEVFAILDALFARWALVGAGVTSVPATRTARVASWCWWLEVETVTHCYAATGLWYGMLPWR